MKCLSLSQIGGPEGILIAHPKSVTTPENPRGVAVRRSGHAAAFFAKRGREASRENLVHSQGARVYKVRKRGFCE